MHSRMEEENEEVIEVKYRFPDLKKTMKCLFYQIKSQGINISIVVRDINLCLYMYDVFKSK